MERDGGETENALGHMGEAVCKEKGVFSCKSLLIMSEALLAKWPRRYGEEKEHL